jgi:uncharacterized membrane protein
MGNLLNILLQQNVEMADAFRADGKIYVVVGIMVMSLLGVVLYLISLDRKVTKLEKQLNK